VREKCHTYGRLESDTSKSGEQLQVQEADDRGRRFGTGLESVGKHYHPTASLSEYHHMKTSTKPRIELEVARYRFLLEATTPIVLPPYKGSTFRGGFGRVFRSMVCCLRETRCRECMVRETCVYSSVFESPVPRSAQVMRKYEASPHPFVITPPLEDKTRYEPGEQMELSLTLIGKSTRYLPYFILAFRELGKVGLGKDRGQYVLRRVLVEQREGPQGTVRETVGYSCDDQRIQESMSTVTYDGFLRDAACFNGLRRVSLRTLTPIRIIHGGKLARAMDFHLLIRALLRRLCLLSYFHCDGASLPVDIKHYVELAKQVRTLCCSLRWRDWQRYSSRQGTRLGMGGLVGTVTYEGELDTFLPFLIAGEYVHVGKGTSLGLGKYRLLMGKED